eukprot:6711849-Pyramimonas_sp.AAC.1
MAAHEGHIQEVADGRPARPEHADQVRRYSLTPLDESRGEGCHRGATHEKKNARRPARLSISSRASDKRHALSTLT